MRMRRKPWARPELDAWDFYIGKPEDYKGRWQTAFDTPRPLHLELGCGKGAFAAQYALRFPEVNLLAVDIKSEMLGLAKRRIEADFQAAGRTIGNVRLTAHDIQWIEAMLAPEDRVERIYINFCNPWPKPRHQKRRLTYPRQLMQYRQFLVEGGEIWLRTDDDGLFHDTLGYLAEAGFAVIEENRDFPPEGYPACPMTEHERMFREEGIPIKFLIARKAPLSA